MAKSPGRPRDGSQSFEIFLPAGTYAYLHEMVENRMFGNSDSQVAAFFIGQALLEAISGGVFTEMRKHGDEGAAKDGHI